MAFGKGDGKLLLPIGDIVVHDVFGKGDEAVVHGLFVRGGGRGHGCFSREAHLFKAQGFWKAGCEWRDRPHLR